MSDQSSTSKVIPEEIAETNSDCQVRLSEESVATRKVSWRDLLYKYATRSDRFKFWMGLLCAFLSGFILPFSYMFQADFVNLNNEGDASIQQVFNVTFVFIGVMLLTAFCSYLERWCLNGFAESLTQRFREQYIHSLLTHDVEFIESMKAGELGQNLAEESSRIINGLGPSIGQLVNAISAFLAGTILGLWHSWQLTLLTLIASPIVVYSGLRYANAMGNWAEALMKDHKEADGLADESIRGIKSVISLNASKHFIHRYSSIIRRCCATLLRCLYRAGGWLGTMTFSNNLAFSLVYFSNTFLIYNQRRRFPEELFHAGCVDSETSSVAYCMSNPLNMTATCQAICDEVNMCWYHARNGKCLVGGDLVVIMCGVMNAFTGLGTAFNAIQAMEKTKASTACFTRIIEHVDEMVDTKAMRPASNKGAIEFKDVSFKYKARDTMILNHLNLTIRENEMIGIVGESGCGKSTILKLLMRLYAPCGGEIDWDGVNVTDLSTHWIREQISYVAQEPVLFSGTIRENLLYGREGASEAEMVEAAKRVEADSFIRQFPKGYDTYVGELGTSLSGGQKQRIAIARALLRHPRIVVLDEATSALDSQSEEIVQRAIEAIREENKAKGSGLSIVVVAHRLSSIRVCDRIVVMEKGHVGEEGTHEELMAKGGLYAGLYETQAMGVTPIEEASEEEKEKEEEREEEKVVIHKEKKKESASRYGLHTIYSFLTRFKWLFWVALFGNLLCAVYPPSYAVIVAFIHSVPFEFDLLVFKRVSLTVSWFMVALAVVYFTGTLTWWDCSSTVKENLVVTLRTKAYSKLLSLPCEYFDDPDHSPNKLTTELAINTRKIHDFMDEIGGVSEAIFMTVAGLALSVSPIGSWKLTLIALCGCPFIFTCEYMQNKVVGDVIERIDRTLVSRSSELTDYVLNIHTVQAYDLGSELYAKMMEELKQTNRLCSSRTQRTAVANLLTFGFRMIYMIICFIFGSLFVKNGWCTFRQMFLVYNMIFIVTNFTAVALGKVPNMKLAQAAANSVFSLLFMKNPEDACRAVKTEGANGDIVFDKVQFAYPTRPEATILKGVSFTIPKNASVAFVGHSGCGKSTIISLIQRFYKPVEGTISLNGVDVNQLNLDWYRGLLGVVNQEPVMFSGTIRENLLMGVDRDVSEEELKSVCEQALCMDFINEMPDGFETDLGATGKAVSGGQKQRLALARAILRNPAILLLDEATSALDSENQEKFLEALDGWRKSHPCTVVTVAHRLSTIVDSDIIFMCENGMIVGSGKHEELLKSCPLYVHLVRGQMG